MRVELEVKEYKSKIRELEETQQRDEKEKIILKNSIQELEAEIQFAEEHIKLRETKHKEDTEKYLNNLMKLNEWENKYTNLSKDFDMLKREFQVYQTKCENEIKTLKSQLNNSIPNDQTEDYKQNEEKIKQVIGQNEMLAMQVNELKSKLNSIPQEKFTSMGSSQRTKYKFTGIVTFIIIK